MCCYSHTEFFQYSGAIFSNRMSTFSQLGLNDEAGGWNSNFCHSVLHLSVNNTFFPFTSRRGVCSMTLVFEVLFCYILLRSLNNP